MNKTSVALFIFYCLSWPVIHFFRWVHHPLPLINGYLTDVTIVPLLAHCSLFIIRKFIARTYCFPLAFLLFSALYIAWVFEWIMPAVSPRYTGDIRDVAAYLAGALFYYFIHQPNYREIAV